MSLPSTQELKNTIEDILENARDENKLSQLTVRIVRHELTARFDLEEDALNGGEYKSFVKETVHATLGRLRSAPDGNADEMSPKRKVAKKKQEKEQSEPTRKRVAKVRVHTSDEEPSEEADDVSEPETPPSKKLPPRSKTLKAVKSTKTPEKPKSEIKYKSKEIIESSDEEAVRLPKKGQPSAKSSPPKQKRKQQQKPNKEDRDVDVNTGEGPGPSSSSPNSKSTTKSRKALTSEAEEPTRDPMESELSSVIDEPPKKRQKKEEKEPLKPQKEEKSKGGKKKETMSKDEETVNKLKSIVVACGVRKVWKKEFEGLDRPSQQIKRLHSILGDLGMTPRYTIEKAKSIRERRELAQELKDVQEFDKATKRRGKGQHSSTVAGESMGHSDSDEDAPSRRKHSARASIMAFLQDQSEED